MSDLFRDALAGRYLWLLRKACVFMRNTLDAQELAHVTIDKALQNEANFTEGTDFDSWLFIIMQRSFIDWTRRSMKESVMDPEVCESMLEAPQRYAYPQQHAHIEWLELHRKLMGVKEAKRIVFIMVEIYGYSYREAAEKLQVPLGTVMSRLSRAREEILANA